MHNQLHLISSDWFEGFASSEQTECLSGFKAANISPSLSQDDSEYYLIASSLYSSKIEGNSLDVNSYYRNKDLPLSPKRKEVEEIENLMAAYHFAADNDLTMKGFLHCHKILSPTLLPAKEQGHLRKDQVGIRDAQSMRPVYLAVEPEFVERELKALFLDIQSLLDSELSEKEIFYNASMIHLWTAMIHPFMDGNSRAARLLEKWFLVSKLGKSAWSLNSEKYYWDNRPAYYQNISLGFNYYALHWERCLPFLLMLPEAVKDAQSK